MNTDIKILLVQKGIRQWRVAKEIGLAEASLSRLLRDKLSPDRKAQIVAVIEKLAAQ